MHPHRLVAACLCAYSLVATPFPVFADAAAEMQKKLQNPLANIKALMTDNAIGFDSGTTEDTSYGLQLQPVYAIDFSEKGFTMILRAVIPILGLEPGTDVPVVGQPSGTESVWAIRWYSCSSRRAPKANGSGAWAHRCRFRRRRSNSWKVHNGEGELRACLSASSPKSCLSPVSWLTFGVKTTSIHCYCNRCSFIPWHRANRLRTTQRSQPIGKRVRITVGQCR